MQLRFRPIPKQTSQLFWRAKGVRSIMSVSSKPGFNSHVSAKHQDSQSRLATSARTSFRALV